MSESIPLNTPEYEALEKLLLGADDAKEARIKEIYEAAHIGKLQNAYAFDSAVSAIQEVDSLIERAKSIYHTRFPDDLRFVKCPKCGKIIWGEAEIIHDSFGRMLIESYAYHCRCGEIFEKYPENSPKLAENH